MRTLLGIVFGIIILLLLASSLLSGCDYGAASPVTLTIQSINATATTYFVAGLTAQAESQQVGAAVAQVVQAQQAQAYSTLDALKSQSSVHASALETQQWAASANLTVAANRTVEILGATATKAYEPTVTAQALVVVTAQAAATATQVKALAVATATAKVMKAELAELNAQVAQAEKSLTQMEDMGLSTDSIQSQLDTLKAQAESKAQTLEGVQSQGGLPGTWPGYGSGGSYRYVVQLGDTWFSISQRFGVPVGELAAVNGMSPYQNLPAGLVLTIPSYYPNPGPVPVPVPGPGSFYVVQPRDTMYSISKRFGVRLEELAAVNGIADYNRIWVGQKLIIPSAGPYPPPIPPVWPTASPIWPPITVTYVPPQPPVTLTPGGNDVYFSTDGRFSVQYPRSWAWGTNTPSGYVMFWARIDRNNPFSVGYAIFSKPSSVWRPAADVLEDYQNALNGASGLMSSLWPGVTFTWDGDVQPYTLGGQLAMGELGYGQSNRVFARATSRDDGSREYMALTWAPSSEWDTSRTTLDDLINTLAFTN